LQVQLSGNTSEPYLGDLQTAARIYQIAGDYAGALPLFRKAIAVADLVVTPTNNWRSAETRMDAAVTLARLGQFDEAETLGEEAVAMHQIMRAPMVSLEQQLAHIRQMKLIAAKSGAGRMEE
jgi:Flp pilus assembly protein TadD